MFHQIAGISLMTAFGEFFDPFPELSRHLGKNTYQYICERVQYQIDHPKDNLTEIFLNNARFLTDSKRPQKAERGERLFYSTVKLLAYHSEKYSSMTVYMKMIKNEYGEPFIKVNTYKLNRRKS